MVSPLLYLYQIYLYQMITVDREYYITVSTALLLSTYYTRHDMRHDTSQIIK